MDSPPSKVKPSFQNISGRKGTLKSLLALSFYPGGKATHHAPQPTSLKASCCAAVVSLAEATLPSGPDCTGQYSECRRWLCETNTLDGEVRGGTQLSCLPTSCSEVLDWAISHSRVQTACLLPSPAVTQTSATPLAVGLTLSMFWVQERTGKRISTLSTPQAQVPAGFLLEKAATINLTFLRKLTEIRTRLRTPDLTSNAFEKHAEARRGHWVPQSWSRG